MRIIVDFRDAGLVETRSGEFAGNDLPAKPLARFEDGDPARRAQLGREVPCRKEASGSSPDNCYAEFRFDRFGIV